MSSNVPGFYYSGHYPGPPPPHNFGPRCRLAPVKNPFSTDPTSGDIPPVTAQFFYSSPIPIDDPLSAIAASHDTKSTRATLQPFSPADNNALEAAWLGLASDDYHQNHDHAYRQRSPNPTLERANTEKLAAIAHHFAVKHVDKHAHEGYARDSMLSVDPPVAAMNIRLPLCCPELLVEVGLALRNSFCAVARRKQHMLHTESVAQIVMAEMQTMRTDSSANATELRGRSDTLSHEQAGSKYESLASARGTTEAPVSAKLPGTNDGITGMPFIRVGTPEPTMFSPPSLSKTGPPPPAPMQTQAQLEEKRVPQPSHEQTLSKHDLDDTPETKTIDVPVGVSRLRT